MGKGHSQSLFTPHKIIGNELMTGADTMRFQFMDGVRIMDIVLPEEMKSLIKEPYEPVTLQFGSWRKDVNIIFSEKINQNHIGIHRELLKPYSNTEDIDFKLKVNENTLVVGPIIAFVFFNKEKSLTPKKLQKHLKYASKYNQFGGLFILSALDSINMKDKTISGYYYNPNCADKWIYGVFPYPEVVFRRSNARVVEMKDLSEATNGKVFNYPILDKWELYQKLKSFPDVIKYFPETIKSKRLTNLNLMLKKYGSVYLKPARGSLAKGIYKIHQENGFYLFKNRRQETIIKSKKGMKRLLSSFKRNYLMQQSIMDQFNGDRNIVFRVILQKDGKMNWCCSGLYARIGLKGSIVTNRHLTDSFLTVENAFIRYYNLNNKEAAELKEEMLKICKKVCEALDQVGGHYADIGFDVMVGNDLRIWIIEANNRAHNHEAPLKTIKDMQMYNKVVMTPLEYAGALADY